VPVVRPRGLWNEDRSGSRTFGEELCKRSVNLLGSEVRLGPMLTQPKSVESLYANLPDIRFSSGTPGEEVGYNEVWDDSACEFVRV